MHLRIERKLGDKRETNSKRHKERQNADRKREEV